MSGTELVFTDRQEFTKRTKLQKWETQDGHCEHCTLKITAANGPPVYDHIKPAALGGDGSFENCQLLCTPCDNLKTDGPDGDISKIADAQRGLEKRAGVRKKKNTGWNKRFKKSPSGKIVERATGRVIREGD